MVQAISEIFSFAEFVFRQINPANRLGAENIRPEVRAIAHAFNFAADVPAKAVIARPHDFFRTVKLVTREMPLADHAGGVAVAL